MPRRGSFVASTHVQRGCPNPNQVWLSLPNRAVGSAEFRSVPENAWRGLRFRRQNGSVSENARWSMCFSGTEARSARLARPGARG